MSSPMLYRAADGWADLEVRAEGDEGIVYGIAVPWDKPTRIDDRLVEEFAAGAFDRQLKRGGPRQVFLARDHIPRGGTPLGRLSLMRNDAAGLYVEGKISRTVVGEETLTLLRDGVLDSLSIGFTEGQNALRDGVTRRLTATLCEVAVVLTPAYKTAVVTGVRGCSCHSGDDAEAAHEHSRAGELAVLLAGLPTLPPAPRRIPTVGV